MQNDSFLFPEEHFGDSLYDLDGDGKLSGLETVLRDDDIMTGMEDDDALFGGDPLLRGPDDDLEDDFDALDDDDF